MRYFIFYLVIQHYFSIFAAEFATLITVLCRTKYVGHQGQACVFSPCRLCPRANPFILLTNQSVLLNDST